MIRGTHTGIGIVNGHWWGKVGTTLSCDTWAPLGKVELQSFMKVRDWLRLSRWYFQAGILNTITGPIVTVDAEGNVLRVEEKLNPVEKSQPDAQTDAERGQ